MTKEFLNKVKREGIVDTKNYRYVHIGYGYKELIKRLPIDWLDTTLAIDGWEIIYEALKK